MIPVFDPVIGEEEIQAVVSALRRGEISGSFGSAIPEFERSFAAYLGCKHAVAVNSGTAALHLAVGALGLKPGEEILVSASTNIASALAAYHQGLITVPVDSEKQTWNLDLDRIESLIGPKTRAIMPVHLYGHPVDMDRLMQIAQKHKLAVIEDCAESHGATVRGRMTGTFGEFGCFSFYANKVITTGEGGMVTTNDDKLAEKIRLLRNLAFIEPRFFHREAGYNFRMPGLQAAMGVVQVGKIEKIIADKRRVAKFYNERLQRIPGLQLPAELPWARNVYWMYAIVLKPDFGLSRNELMQRLKKLGVDTRTFFCPMNQQPVLREQAGYREVDCPVADALWENGLYLPSGPTLTKEQIDQIGQRIEEARSPAFGKING